MPVAVGIGLTNECNLDCPHCYRPTLTRQRLSVPEVETTTVFRYSRWIPRESAGRLPKEVR